MFDVQMMNICIFLSQSKFKANGFDSDILVTISGTQDNGHGPILDEEEISEL